MAYLMKLTSVKTVIVMDLLTRNDSKILRSLFFDFEKPDIRRASLNKKRAHSVMIQYMGSF